MTPTLYITLIMGLFPNIMN